MSQEFEKIVLEKLDKIDAKLDEHTKTLNQHSKLIKDNTQAIDSNRELIQKNTKEMTELRDVVLSHTDSLIKIERKVNDIADTTRLYGNMLIEHEYDLNLKFDTLMDAFSMNKQKHAEYDDLFLHHNKKCQDFDVRIFKLETDMKNLKTA